MTVSIFTFKNRVHVDIDGVMYDGECSWLSGVFKCCFKLFTHKLKLKISGGLK